MIAAGLMRAVARKPLWSLAMRPRAIGAVAIAGVAAAPVFLTAPALAGTGGNAATRAGVRVVTSCGAGVSAVNVRLPAGFDPLTATPAQRPPAICRSGPPAGSAGRVAEVRHRGVRAARTTWLFAAVTPPARRGRSWATRAQLVVGDAKPARSSVTRSGNPQSIVGDGPGQSQ
jgi:hypothetical protein